MIDKLLEAADATITQLKKDMQHITLSQGISEIIDSENPMFGISENSETIAYCNLNQMLTPEQCAEIKSKIKAFLAENRESAINHIEHLIKFDDKTKNKEELVEMKGAVLTQSEDYYPELLDRQQEQEKKKKFTEILESVDEGAKKKYEKLDDKIIKKEYFKNGKSVKEIAAQYNFEKSGVYTRIRKMQKELQENSKECATL